jgi:aspartate/methionine/tyrosine aminotransferase
MKVTPLGPEAWARKYGGRASISFGVEAEPLRLGEILSAEEAARLGDRLSRWDLAYGLGEMEQALKALIACLYEDVSREEILLTSGVSEANYLVLNALLDGADGMIVEAPAFQQHFQIAEGRGIEVKRWWVREVNGRYALDVEELERLIDDRTRLVIINNPQNPTGFAIERDVLQGVIDLLRERGIHLYSNELFRGLQIKDGFVFPSAHELDPWAISASGLSKVWGCGGLRLGWFLASKDVIERLATYQAYTSLRHAAKLSVFAAIEVLAKRERVLACRRETVRKNLELLRRWVAAEEHLHCVVPDEGLTALVRYDLDLASEEFCLKLLEGTGVLACPGSYFGVERSFRIGIGLPAEEFEVGLKSISGFVRKMKEEART